MTWILCILAAMWLLSFAMLAVLPEQVAMHWNAQGEVTRYGTKWQAVLALPVIATIASAFLLALPRIGTLEESMKRSAGVYGKAVIALLAMLFSLHVLVLLGGVGFEIPVARLAIVGGGGLVALLGNWMGKLRRNFWIGIRTPWTLANDVVWERTHRIGGRLFLVHGVVTAIVALIAPPLAAVIWLVAGVLAIAVWSIPYSLSMYRRTSSI